MIHPYVDPAWQGDGVVVRSEMYSEQQVHRTSVGLEQHHQREPSVEQQEKTEPATLAHRSEPHLEEQHLQGLCPASSKQHQQRYLEIAALEQQLQQYCAAEAIQRQRLLDVDLSRSRMLERFQLERIIRSKEAGAQVEALDRRMQQHEAEAAWRSQRNSYLRGMVFEILHWKLKRKHASEAVSRLRKQQSKFEKEVMRFLKADTTPGGASSLRVSCAAAHQQPYVTDGGPGAFPNCAPEDHSVIVKLQSDCASGSNGSIAMKGSTPNERSCTTGSDGGMCFRGQREDVSVDTLSPATPETIAAKILTQYNRSCASSSASAGSTGNVDKKIVVNRDCRAQVSVPGSTTEKPTCIAEPTLSSISPRTSACARSLMLKDLNFPAVVLSSKTSKYSPRSSEPAHLQLLALRYKQEMTTLLQQQQGAHRRLASPHRHQGECRTPSECAKPDSIRPSSSSGNTQVSSSSTAYVPGGTGHAQGKHSLRTHGSTPSKAHLAQSTTQEPPESCPAAPQLATTTGATTSSAGAMFPPRTSKCSSTKTTLPHAGMSATVPQLNSTAGGEFPSARPANDGRSVPVRLSAVSSATACPPAQPAPSSQNSPSYATSLVHIAEGTVAGNGGCSALAGFPAAEEKQGVDAGAAVHPGIRVGENVAAKASSYNASSGEAVTRSRHTAAKSGRLAEESADLHQPGHASRASQNNLEWQASVKNEPSNEWMSPEIPTEKPPPELWSCDVL